ncbi:TetR family transcriptional regulator [Streptomyces sp. NPDC004610]|uniref:TetR/AcrR family transcriptional regulator n=1 Tax=unclassified Streptomyces TaxID=2593676 RepID=UPI0033A0583E
MTRADAVRNRRLLMDAATAEFAENGMDASITRIAARAGVAKGTVFRHFDTKEQLLSEIFSDRLEELVAAGERLADAADPRAALLEFMEIGTEIQARDRSFCQAAAALSRSEPSVRTSRQRLADVAETLAARAREAGAIRDDVTGLDIVLLLSAASQAVLSLGRETPDLWRRYLALIFDGLTPTTARPLPEPAPSWEQFAG